MICWGFWDGAHWNKQAPFFREDWSPKPALKVWEELVLGRWKTQAAAATNASGQAWLRGHFGEYKVRVEAGGKKAERSLVLGKDGASLEVVLK
jgi:endo-1,4-beta-xylanase